MLDAVNALLLALWAMLGAAPLPDSAAGALAVAVVAVTVLALVAATAGTGAELGTRRAHPVRAMAVSDPLDQSDPDAPGHPRPRAPGRAAPAA